MQYSPKLKMAMEDIKAILNKYDIAASVVLHTPGNGEFLMRVDPSYSCARFDEGYLRIRAKLIEDFKGDKDAWTKKVNDTTNMLITFIDLNNHLTAGLVNTLTMLKRHIEIDGGPGDITTRTQQNN